MVCYKSVLKCTIIPRPFFFFFPGSQIRDRCVEMHTYFAPCELCMKPGPHLYQDQARPGFGYPRPSPAQQTETIASP